jgi:hypothetical protein
MQPACVHGLTDERTWEASAVVVPGKVALLRLIQPTLVDWACIPVRMLRHTAVFREWGNPVRPPSWLVQQAIVYQYQRLNASAPCFVQNVAYESGVYLKFIVDLYDNLPAFTVFAQADWFAARKGQPFPHSPFRFWQLDCVRGARHTHAAAPDWAHWMPLGLRNTICKAALGSNQQACWQALSLAHCPTAARPRRSGLLPP